MSHSYYEGEVRSPKELSVETSACPHTSAMFRPWSAQLARLDCLAVQILPEVQPEKGAAEPVLLAARRSVDSGGFDQ